jgi:Asp-tRNA(Asn)/Glu-tRNA(Gln) amidotransferase A subunit family amidase
MSHPQDLSLRDQAAGVASGDLDPRELLRATLDRIAERDGPLNSVVATFPEESERMLAAAPPGPLHGVPIAVKDMFQLPWRGPRDGAPREALPAGESGIYRVLRDAGAVIVGVTQMHFWGGGSTGHVSADGPVGNAWNAEHCGGGSSGGSAAAVGARLVAGAVGTDGGGSVRLPAAYNGITGLKGTYGSSDRSGYTHANSTMGEAGPMCRDAADARLLGSVLYGRALTGDTSRAPGLRIGLVRTPFWEDNDSEVDEACRAALSATGWQTSELPLPLAEHVKVVSVLRLTLEGLPSLTEQDLADADPLTRALVKYEMLLPAHWLVRGDRVRSELRRGVAAAFESCDLLAWPTVSAPSPRIDNPSVTVPSGVTAPDAVNVRQAGIANLTGQPGINVPVGVHSSGLPMGLQLLGPWGSEELLLDAAEHVEQATGRQWVDAVPPIAASSQAAA